MSSSDERTTIDAVLASLIGDAMPSDAAFEQALRDALAGGTGFLMVAPDGVQRIAPEDFYQPPDAEDATNG